MIDSAKLSFKLQNLLGSTTTTISQLGHAQNCLIYIAGVYVVFYSPVLDEQVAYLRHSSPFINTIAVSRDQTLLAVADGAKSPCISVYSIKDLSQLDGNYHAPNYVLRGHKHAVDMVVFSPNGRYILSISNHDGSMFLWQKSDCITKNKVSKAVTRAMFDGAGDLVTVGRGYFKIWKFNNGEVVKRREDECWMMDGRVFTFGKTFTTKQFIDFAFYQAGTLPNAGKDKVLLLANDGLLCIMQSNYEKIEKWIDLSMQKATALELVNNLALCSGDNSLVKIIDLESLSLLCKFPKPPPTNKENLNKDEILQYSENQEFPLCVGVRKVGELMATLYANRTIFLWRLEDEPVAVRSIITHKSRILSLCLLQQVKNICFFSSVSQDRTLRLWHLYKKQFGGNYQSVDVAEAIGIKRNVYCKNLTRIIYSESQLPITKMKMHKNSAIACISAQEFLLYSLDNFQLMLHHNFQDDNVNPLSNRRLLSLEVQQEFIYIGNDSGDLGVYRPQEEKLIKLKEYKMEMPVQSLQIFGKRILAYGKGKMRCLSLQGQIILNQYNLECCFASPTHIVMCQKRSVSFYNLARQKKAASVSLSHELDENEQIKAVRSNSWIIALLTNKNRLLITNFSSAILFSEELYENITDLAVTEGGEVLLATEGGTILIKKQEGTKYQRIDSKVKKWFEENDMSWVDGSVWASKNKSLSCQKSKQSIEIQAGNANSIRIGSQYQPLIDRSIGLHHELPNVALSYKNEDNKKSIFNPSSICAQANKIYNNINQIMKNRQQSKQQPELVESIDISNMPKKRIFQNVSPKFTNNLVESVLSNGKDSSKARGISTEDNIERVTQSANTINFGLSQFVEQQPPNPDEKLTYTESNFKKEDICTGAFLESVKVMINQFDSLKNNKQYTQSMVLEHQPEFEKIYELLHLVMGQGKRREWTAGVKASFNKLVEQFSGQLQK